ncbi:MAG: hypothetical protein ACWA5T_12120 [Parvularcula sp.]
MDNLGYILSVAFSGADLTRAIWLAVIGSLIASKYLPPVKATFLLLIIDRVWPFLTMGLNGHDVRAVSAAVGNAIATIPQDALTILIRGLVLYLVVLGGYQMRLRLHGKQAVLATDKRR